MSYSFSQQLNEASDLRAIRRAPFAQIQNQIDAFLTYISDSGIPVRWKWVAAERKNISAKQEEQNIECRIEFFTFFSGQTIEETPANGAILLELRHLIEINPENSTTHPVTLQPYISQSTWFSNGLGYEGQQMFPILGIKIEDFMPNKRGSTYGDLFTLREGELGDAFQEEFGSMVMNAIRAGFVPKLQGESLSQYLNLKPLTHHSL